MQKKLLVCALFLSCVFQHIYTTEKEYESYPQIHILDDQSYIDLLKEAQEDVALKHAMTDEDHKEIRSVNQKKPYTFIVFMAADNDLHPFAWRNLKHLELIGSTEYINVIVQLNIPGHYNPTRRYVVKQGKRLLVDADPSINNVKLNSGNPHTLVDCVAWAHKHYPADEFIIDLWNHGTGPCDPGTSRTVSATELFSLNPISNMLDLDRSVGYLEYLSKRALQKEVLQRGICFDETFRSFMSNQDLDFALHEICTKVLGKKIGILGFDACLMSAVEIANIAKKYAKYMVSSEEVELAYGWPYDAVLRPLVASALPLKDLASHIVKSFDNFYIPITPDYTLSAINLAEVAALEANINNLASTLIEALQTQKNDSVRKAIRFAKSRKYCVCFEEPSYIDLGDFYKNLIKFIDFIELGNKQNEAYLKHRIKYFAAEGISLLEKCVAENRTGKNLSNAKGLSIYFPEGQFAHSYLKNPFASENNWAVLIAKYLLA